MKKKDLLRENEELRADNSWLESRVAYHKEQYNLAKAYIVQLKDLIKDLQESERQLQNRLWAERQLTGELCIDIELMETKD